MLSEMSFDEDAGSDFMDDDEDDDDAEDEISLVIAETESKKKKTVLKKKGNPVFSSYVRIHYFCTSNMGMFLTLD